MHVWLKVDFKSNLSQWIGEKLLKSCRKTVRLWKVHLASIFDSSLHTRMTIDCGCCTLGVVGRQGFERELKIAHLIVHHIFVAVFVVIFTHYC